MQRREFVVLLGAATVAWPVAALAQPSERIRRVGILVGSAESDPNIQAWIAEVQNGLAALGWRNGQNVHFERRFAGGDVGLTQHHAQELVRLDLDVIVTSSTPAALALLRETRSILVVGRTLAGRTCREPDSVNLEATIAHPLKQLEHRREIG
jgi:putative tryptophan/tyrosine transport system substrate-binding protein